MVELCLQFHLHLNVALSFQGSQLEFFVSSLPPKNPPGDSPSFRIAEKLKLGAA